MSGPNYILRGIGFILSGVSFWREVKYTGSFNRLLHYSKRKFYSYPSNVFSTTNDASIRYKSCKHGKHKSASSVRYSLWEDGTQELCQLQAQGKKLVCECMSHVYHSWYYRVCAFSSCTWSNLSTSISYPSLFFLCLSKLCFATTFKDSREYKKILSRK